MKKINLNGVFPPMITPFSEDEQVDYGAHIRNLERWNKASLRGYLVLGSNSETIYLSENEKIKLIEITVKHAAKDRVILAGTGMDSARETIDLTNRAADLGVHAALVLTPFYYHREMNEKALIDYFSAVAGHSTIPILIYNVPKFTHVNITIGAVKTLSQHPNIIGMKDSTGDIPQLVSHQLVIDEQFELLSGTVSSWYPALTLGVSGGIFAAANCIPNECVTLQEAFDSGNRKGAEKIYRKIFPVNAAVTGGFGIAGLKYAADLLGYEGGYVRKPLQPLDDIAKKSLHKILQKAELI